MNRLRCVIAGALLGCLIIGPAVNYAMAIVRFAAGLVSSNELTRSAPQTLLLGAIVGFVSGLACGVTGCRGLPTTAWVMGIAFAFYACFFGWSERAGSGCHSRGRPLDGPVVFGDGSSMGQYARPHANQYGRCTT